MIEFIYAYGDLIQFIIYVLNAVAVGVAALLAACYWVKFVNRTTACCKGDKGHGYHAIHGYHGHKHGAGECCSDSAKAPEAPAADVDVAKFVD